MGADIVSFENTQDFLGNHVVMLQGRKPSIPGESAHDLLRSKFEGTSSAYFDMEQDKAINVEDLSEVGKKNTYKDKRDHSKSSSNSFDINMLSQVPAHSMINLTKITGNGQGQTQHHSQSSSLLLNSSLISHTLTNVNNNAQNMTHLQY